MRNRKHDIERYLKGDLSPGEMHALEKEALNDPFLAEALEGVEQAGKDNFLFDLHKLNRSVHDRTRKRKTKTLTMLGWPTGIAATLLLIAVSGYLVVSLLKDQDARQHAMQKEASPQDTTALADSLTVGSGPVAQFESSEEELPVRKETPSPRADQSQPGQEKNQARAEEKPVEEAIDLKKELLAEQEIEEEQAEKADAAREALAIADASEPEVKEQQHPASESKKKTDGPELAGATQRARVGDVPSRAPSISGALVADSTLIKGKVLSAEDGEAMPGVNVTLKGAGKGTVTDATGSYQLSIPAPDTSLVFSFIGFETQEVAVAGQPELNVVLNEDVSSLSEVVIVSGYGSANDNPADETFSAAEPQTGRSDFKDYLEKSVKYPEEAIKNKTEGKVTVRFAVEPSGRLTGFEILKGIGSGCDEELIRAIREGPGWRPAKQGERAVSDKVKVRYRFELPF